MRLPAPPLIAPQKSANVISGWREDVHLAHTLYCDDDAFCSPPVGVNTLLKATAGHRSRPPYRCLVFRQKHFTQQDWATESPSVAERTVPRNVTPRKRRILRLRWEGQGSRTETRSSQPSTAQWLRHPAGDLTATILAFLLSRLLVSCALSIQTRRRCAPNH